MNNKRRKDEKIHESIGTGKVGGILKRGAYTRTPGNNGYEKQEKAVTQPTPFSDKRDK